MTDFNPRMQHVKQSATFAAKAKANALRAKGRRVVDLTFGEPEIDTPDFVKDAAIQALKSGKTKYTAVAGIPELRAAIAQRVSSDRGTSVSPDSVIVTNGGKQAIHECLNVLVRDGEEVLLIAPYWVSYPEMVHLSGGTPVVVTPSPERGWRLSPEELSRALTPRTRMVILNCPSNPTGICYSAAELRAFGEVLKRHSCFILSDEVYDRITYDGKPYLPLAAALPELAERIVTVNSFSKTYSMTGWRVGWACGDAEIIDAMIRFQSQATSSINTPAQYAALTALSDTAFAASLSKRYEERIRRASSLLSAPGTHLAVPASPEGAYYLFVRAEPLMAKKRLRTSLELADKILDATGVTVVAGSAFGDDYSFRISATCPQEDFDYAIGVLANLHQSL